MLVIDGHAHLFTEGVIKNVSAKADLVHLLHLEINEASRRYHITTLKESCQEGGVSACLLLPTASVKQVAKTNDFFFDLSANEKSFIPAGTVHPYDKKKEEELNRLSQRGIRALKLCSFSQGFSLEDEETKQLFFRIAQINEAKEGTFFIILDTFYLAHRYFGTPLRHTTTPKLLAGIIKKYPSINFVAAHMGGLAAPFEEIITNLIPSKNLFLDTSNAAHVLKEEEFLSLLTQHGPEHIIFGTDWPWFGHSKEVEKINRLLDKAGFLPEEKERVFAKNVLSLLKNDLFSLT